MRKIIMTLLTLVVFTSILLPINNGYIIKNAEAVIPQSNIEVDCMHSGAATILLDHKHFEDNLIFYSFTQKVESKTQLVIMMYFPDAKFIRNDEDVSYGTNPSYTFSRALTAIRLRPANDIDNKKAEVSIVSTEHYTGNKRATAIFDIPEQYKDYVLYNFITTGGGKTYERFDFNFYDTVEFSDKTYKVDINLRIALTNPIPMNTWFNNVPTVPGLFTTPTSSTTIKGGEILTVGWGSSSDPDGDTVRYQLQFYNGSTWSTVTSSTTATSYTWTVPTDITTSNAKFRVRAYDGTDYSSYRESNLFSIYQNSAPDIELTSPINNQTIR